MPAEVNRAFCDTEILIINAQRFCTMTQYNYTDTAMFHQFTRKSTNFDKQTDISLGALLSLATLGNEVDKIRKNRTKPSKCIVRIPD